MTPLETIRARLGNLSRRQRQVLMCVALGMSYEKIAKRLGISKHTVKWHLQAALDCTAATDRVHLVAAMGIMGMLDTREIAGGFL